MRENDEPIIELEERLMHQERLLEKLNEIVTAQQGQIEKLQREIERLTQQLAEGRSEDVNDPPPHY